MPIDPRRLRPAELCRLLNSTPLGEVINTVLLRHHRERAGLRIGEGRHVDLVRYAAWLVQVRHLPKQEPAGTTSADPLLAEAALGAAKLACRQQPLQGHGQKFTHKHEALIAALLTEPTYAQAAQKAGVSKRTLYRWLRLPAFHAAYGQARRLLVEAAVGRMQAATGQVADALLNVACHGRRDGDRTRTAIAVLNFSVRDRTSADIFHNTPIEADVSPLGISGVVKLLQALLQQVERSALPIAEKSRLTVALADALLRAINEDEVVKRQEALLSILQNRREEKP